MQMITSLTTLRGLPLPDLLRQLCHFQGNSASIRRVLRERPEELERFLRGPVRHQERQSTPRRNGKETVLSALEGRLTVRHGAAAILESGWNFVDPGWSPSDPSKRMNKDPEEVRSILEELTDETRVFGELSDKGRNLVDMIFKSYLRALRWSRTK
jgi:hypothetical protein